MMWSHGANNIDNQSALHFSSNLVFLREQNIQKLVIFSSEKNPFWYHQNFHFLLPMISLPIFS